MGKSKSNQKPKKTAVNKGSRQPWFTLIISTLACLALVVALYYANKANHLKSKDLKEGSKGTGEQRAKRNVHPTEKPSETMKQSRFASQDDILDNEQNEGKTQKKTNESANRTSSSTKDRNPSNEKRGKIKGKQSSSSNTAQKKETKASPLVDFKRVPRLDGVKVGYERTMELEPGKKYKVITRSLRPPIFEIPNFLTDGECQEIIQQADRQVLESSPVDDINNENIESTSVGTFHEWDYNHDNGISPLEVMHNLIDLSDLYFSEKDIMQMFKDLKVDKNKNGVIDLDEFLQVTTDRIVKYLHNMARTLDRVKGRNSKQTWADHSLVKGLDERVAALTKLPVVVVAESEKLQVVQYDPEGHYHCHHDSQPVEQEVPCCYERDQRHCRLCRYITVLYFLNDVEEGGETAFPVADNSTFSIEAWSALTKYRCDLSKHCHKANLVIPPKKGTAVMWYNHHLDPTTGWVGDLDEITFHGGCDVIRGEKWIANNWINIMGKSRSHMITHTNPKRKL